ncbi:MAG: hypothetical protein CUN55_02665 [Phototrophicales bacterium]|nr:MAG: hypothetical protein CUN55_02665 [Phototrophicales bacterium]
MTLPALKEWETTRDTLHRTALVLNVLQRALAPQERPFSLQYSLDVVKDGFSTYALKGAKARLDLSVPAVRLQFQSGGSLTYALSGSNPAQLVESLVNAFEAEGIPLSITNDDTRPFELDSTTARAYSQVLDTMYTILARVRAKIMGYWSPLVLWAHHFDLSQLWFPEPSQHDEHNDPQINLGFSPGDENIPRPYIYLYAWSKDKGYIHEGELPEPAFWNPEGYTGVRIDYDALAGRDDALTAFQEVILASYYVLAKRL